MAVFWQHVGDQNARRDLPRTIGTPSSGLREFSLTEIESGIDVECGERADLARSLARIGNSAFKFGDFRAGQKRCSERWKPVITFCSWIAMQTGVRSAISVECFFGCPASSGNCRNGFGARDATRLSHSFADNS